MHTYSICARLRAGSSTPVRVVDASMFYARIVKRAGIDGGSSRTVGRWRIASRVRAVFSAHVASGYHCTLFSCASGHQASAQISGHTAPDPASVRVGVAGRRLLLVLTLGRGLCWVMMNLLSVAVCAMRKPRSFSTWWGRNLVCNFLSPVRQYRMLRMLCTSCRTKTDLRLSAAGWILLSRPYFAARGRRRNSFAAGTYNQRGSTLARSF